MSNGRKRPSGAPAPGQAQIAARPGLIPAEPLPVWTALVQVVLLLGIPLTLLVLAKFILRRFFPALGY